MDNFLLLLKQEVENERDYLVQMRRRLHEIPEQSAQELQTSQLLKEEIEKLGLPIIEVDATSFIAILDTKRPGRTIGLRSDIDALPVQENENNLAGKRVCISKREGFMHACGHDGHMAMLLTCAKILKKMELHLQGKVLFIFEQGEEMGTGIPAMIDTLKTMSIDAVYGNHLTAFMDTGTISAKPGPVMAGSCLVEFDVVGKGGHGSRPDLSINPIFAAANILNALNSAWTNQLDVTKTVTLGIGALQAGNVDAANVIPNTATIAGTLRFFDTEEGAKAFHIVEDVAQITAKASRCHIQFSKRHRIAANPVVNDENLAARFKKSVGSFFGDHFKEDIIWFASESFSRYREVAPSLFAFVGMRDAKVGSGAEHHNEYFDLDEKALEYGTIAMGTFAHDFLMEAPDEN